MEIESKLMTSIDKSREVLKRNGFVKQRNRKDMGEVWVLTVPDLRDLMDKPYTKVYTVMLGDAGYAHDPYGWVKISSYNGIRLMPEQGFVTFEIAHKILSSENPQSANS